MKNALARLAAAMLAVSAAPGGTFVYDDSGRLLSASTSGGLDTGYATDAEGNITAATAGGGDSDGNRLSDWWEQHFFGTTGVSPMAAPAGDGVSNLMKYALGLAPLQAQAAPLATVTTQVHSDEQSYRFFTFVRSKAHGAITSLQQSSNGVQWVGGATYFEQIGAAEDLGNGTERVTFRNRTALPAGDALSFRLLADAGAGVATSNLINSTPGVPSAPLWAIAILFGALAWLLSRRRWSVAAALLVAAASGLAESGPGWFAAEPAGVPEPGAPPLVVAPSSPAFAPMTQSMSAGSGATAVTPELEAVASGLQNDPVAIFNFVRNKIRYQVYYGSAKGAHGTWLDEAGNDMDHASLLIALLNAAGFTQTSYVYGTVGIRESSPDGTDLAHWFGCAPGAAAWTLGYAWIPNWTRYYDGPHLASRFDHVWVRVVIGGVTYDLDPSFKLHDFWEPMNLKAITGYSRSQLVTDAGGTVTGDYVTNLSQSALENRFTQYATALRNHVATQAPHASVEEVTGGTRLREESLTSLAQAAARLATLSPQVTTTFTAIPNSYRSSLRVRVGTQVDRTFFTDMLAGRRVSLTFNGLNAQLWLGDTLEAAETNGSGTNASVIYSIAHPTANHSQALAATNYLRTGRYDLTYALYPNPFSGGRPAASERRIRDYLASGLVDSSRQVLTETLHQYGIQWARRVALSHTMTARVSKAQPFPVHIIGRTGQESGYYVDMPGCLLSSFDAQGTNRTDVFKSAMWMLSAMEHGVIEQLTGVASASTVKCLVLANAGGQRIYRVTSSNWSGVSGQLQNYTTAEKNFIASFANTVGNVLLVHRNGDTPLNQWTGFGFSSLRDGRGDMMIFGGLSGGFASQGGEASGSQFTIFSGFSLELGFSNLLQTLSAEPVDLASGAYTMDAVDLELGEAETPRGLVFRRSYDSSRRGESGALGRGWKHSLEGRVGLTTNLEAAFGLRQPVEAAEAMVAAMVAPDFVSATSPAKELMIAAFAANWMVDRITNNAANVEIGNKRLAFIARAGGGWTRPPGSTATLTGASGNFTLSPRFGGNITFTNNRVSQWRDVDNNTQTYAYDTSGRLSTVTDSQGRVLTFSYNGTSPLIQSVSDGTGRSVSFSYTGNGTAGFNLTRITNPEGFHTNLAYDTRHRLTHWRDHNNALMVINTYDAQDRVTEQLSQGQSVRRWQFLYSPGETREVNPLGEVTAHEFDAWGRRTALRDGLGNRQTFTYNNQNQVVSETDGSGRTTTHVFDGNLNLTSSTVGGNQTTTRDYDASLRLWKITDPTNRTTEFGYDPENHLTSIKDPGGRITTMEYRADGRLTKITHPDTRTTLYTAFDQWANPTGVTRPDGTTTTSAFNARGDLTSYTDGRGKTTTFQHDRRRLLTSRTDANGRTSTWTYDALGHPATATDRNNKTTTTVHDNFGKLLSLTAPDTGTATFGHDLADRSTTVTDALNHTTTTGYDSAGRAILTTNAEGIATGTDYDAAGRITALLDGRGKETQFFFDAAGRLSHSLDPMNRRVDHTYDAAGRDLTLKNRLSRTFTHGYGTDGLPTTFTHPSGRQSQIVDRDPAGRPKTLREPSGQQTALTYDGAGRIKTRADGAGTITTTYDNEGNPTAVTEGSATITRTFDNLGRVLSCTDTLGQTVGYTYDPEGNLSTITYPGNKTVTYGYDGSNRLKTITDWAGRLTTYTYDTIGRLIRVDRPNGTRQRLEYDDANRLIATFEERGATALWQAAYVLDDANRITQFNATPMPRPFAPPSATMTYDLDNRLATYNGQPVTSDLDGNLLAAPLHGTLLGNLTWDARNRLTAASPLNTENGTLNTSYAYDAEGRRTTRTIGANQTTTYIWSRGAALDRLLVTQNPDGSTTRYIHGLGLAYEEHTPAGGGTPTTTFYHFNWQGSTVALTDSNGNITARLSYSPYGERTIEYLSGFPSPPSGFSPSPFCFNGQWGVLTEPNGLYHLQARFYSPILRRFLSEDPAGFAGGLNLYAYAGGDPVNLMDPFGLGPVGASNFWSGLTGVFGLNGWEYRASDPFAVPAWANNDYYKSLTLPTGTWAIGYALAGGGMMGGEGGLALVWDARGNAAVFGTVGARGGAIAGIGMGPFFSFSNAGSISELAGVGSGIFVDVGPAGGLSFDQGGRVFPGSSSSTPMSVTLSIPAASRGLIWGTGGHLTYSEPIWTLTGSR